MGIVSTNKDIFIKKHRELAGSSKERAMCFKLLILTCTAYIVKTAEVQKCESEMSLRDENLPLEHISLEEGDSIKGEFAIGSDVCVLCKHKKGEGSFVIPDGKHNNLKITINADRLQVIVDGASKDTDDGVKCTVFYFNQTTQENMSQNFIIDVHRHGNTETFARLDDHRPQLDLIMAVVVAMLTIVILIAVTAIFLYNRRNNSPSQESTQMTSFADGHRQDVDLSDRIYEEVDEYQRHSYEFVYKDEIQHIDGNAYDVVSEEGPSNEHFYDEAASPSPPGSHQTPGLLYGDLGPPIRGEQRQVAAPNHSNYSEVMKDKHNMPIHWGNRDYEDI